MLYLLFSGGGLCSCVKEEKQRVSRHMKWAPHVVSGTAQWRTQSYCKVKASTLVLQGGSEPSSSAEVTELSLCAVLLIQGLWSHDCLLNWFRLRSHHQVMLANLSDFMKAG